MLPKLSKVCSKPDKWRSGTPTENVRLTAPGGIPTAAATNGALLVILPLDHARAALAPAWSIPAAGILIPAAAWARGEKDKGQTVIGPESLTLSTGEIVPYIAAPGSSFPNLEAVLPTADDLGPAVKLNAEYLAVIAAALDTPENENPASLAVAFNKTEGKPAHLTGAAPGGIAVLMPVARPKA